MSGEHSELLTTLKDVLDDIDLIPENARSIVRYLVEHILITQYIKMYRDPHRHIWVVQVGTGMGLTFSGELSDTCFLELVERSWIGLDSVQKDLHINMYRRFRDDVLVIADEKAGLIIMANYNNRLEVSLTQLLLGLSITASIPFCTKPAKDALQVFLNLENNHS